jgi:hypothetical protein
MALTNKYAVYVNYAVDIDMRAAYSTYQAEREFALPSGPNRNPSRRWIMATITLLPRAANDNDRDANPISVAQARHLRELPTYLRGGRI